MWVKWKLVSVRLQILLILAQDRCTICAESTTAWKSFWVDLMVLLGDVGQVEALSVRLEIVFDMNPQGFVVDLSMRSVR
jgi:hypothetical protein